MTDPAIDVSRYMDLARRRWLLVAALALMGLAIGGAIALSLPAVYSSTARILVASPQIPESLARSTIESGAVERVRLIEQRMMTRQNLLEIAERFRVFEDRPGMSPTAIVDEMRAATTIRNVALATTGRRQVTASAVDVSFRSADPQKAAQVANEMVSRLLERNLRERSAQVTATLDFFTGEVQRLSQEITRTEAALEQFKIDNDAALPESLSFRREQLALIEARIPEQQRQRLALEEQRRRVEDALSRGVPIVQTEGPLTPEEQELNRLRQTMIQQRAIYAESHPAVRSLQARIDALAAAVAAATATAVGDAPGQPQESLADVSAQRQIDLIDEQIAFLDRQASEDEARLEELQASIERTPSVEIALGGYQRDLVALQTQLQQARLREAEAAIGERLEVTQQSERFELVEQAQPPGRPDSPNRPLIAAAGLAGGGGLGVALTFLLEILNGSIRSSRDLERRLDMRPIVTVPYIRTAAEIWRRKWALRLTAVLFLAAVPAAIYLIDRFHTPLPLLARRAMSMAGL